MERKVNLNEITDGRLYGTGDMVKAGCGDCSGCHLCCTGMGTSIILDPYDVYRITQGTGLSFDQMINVNVELNVVDGIILPNIKLTGSEEKCTFLDANGRCSIHPYRPGICRMFPLGRIYNDNGFKYFLQINECPKPNKVKVKVSRWIDTPQLAEYEKYIWDWHCFLKEMEKLVAQLNNSEAAHNVSVMVMRFFYLTMFDNTREFYGQFYERLEYIRKRLGEL